MSIRHRGASPPKRPTRVAVALLIGLAGLLLALATMGGSAAAEAPVDAAATVDRDRIHVGDAMTLSLVVQAAAGYRVVDPGVPRVFGDFEILETLPAQQGPARGGVTRLVFRYRVTTFLLGDVAIPPIVVAYAGPSGEPGVATTNTVPVHVESVIGPGEVVSDIRPLVPQLVLPGALMPQLARAAALAEGALALAIVAVLVVRRLRQPRAAAAGGPARPVHEALAELLRLAELRLPEQGRLQEHYELLAAALRRYVRARFGLSAAERTPRELRGDLERAGADRQQVALVYQLLHEAELARYRHKAPYPAHAREAVRAALEIVRKAAADEEYEMSAGGAP